jgi:hypothetical protein
LPLLQIVLCLNWFASGVILRKRLSQLGLILDPEDGTSWSLRITWLYTKEACCYTCTLTFINYVLWWCKVKVKLYLKQAVEAHRVLRGRGSHIFSRQTAHRWRRGCQLYAPAVLSPQEDSWYSFLLEAKLTPRPQYCWKHYVNWKTQWPHRKLNSQPSGL